MKLREALKGKLTKKEFSFLRTAYDILGDIAIIEIPPELKKKEKIIAETLLGLRNEVKTVVKKSGIHKGKFRLQKHKVLAGEKKKETVHKENNVRLKLNIDKVYFSARMSTERKRIAGMVKKDEEILVMFSGCAPYPCVIAKNTSAKEIYGVELNKTAHNYSVENLKLNKIRNVELIKGDVKKIVPKLNKKFDRVLMPLPKGAETFLNIALEAVKKGGLIHFYDFLHENEFGKAREKVKKACKKAGKKCRILRLVRCGQYSPGVYRICVDFRIS